VWQRKNDLTTGWTKQAQLGDLTSLGSVGDDRSFGFYAAVFGKETILATLSTGSIVCYNKDESGSFVEDFPLVTGHTRAVTDLAWADDYLLSCGLDMTTRLWAAPSMEGKYCEMARPQVHGYEMHAIDSIQGSGRFLSAGDEKILRSFVAPSAADNSISVPALGLSNKQANETSNKEVEVNRIRTETELRQTLWPETDKLYGHGLEVQTLAVSHSGQLAVSSNKATNSEDAVIRFWEQTTAGTWKQIGTVPGHSLTVIRLVWGPDDGRVLAVSRDRHWSIIRVSPSEDGWQMAVERSTEAHARIIWDGDWAPDGSFFVTVSRDRRLRCWNSNDGIELPFASIEFQCSVTAVAINHMEADGATIMAVGTELGEISFYKMEQDKWTPLPINHFNQPSAAVTRLRWNKEFMLAAASEDHSVRIYRMTS